jgi:hypothetical protein
VVATNLLRVRDQLGATSNKNERRTRLRAGGVTATTDGRRSSRSSRPSSTT